MAIWTDIEKRIVYITRPNMWKGSRGRGNDNRLLEGLGYNPRITLKFLKALNGKTKLLGKRRRGQHHAKYWNIKILEHGQTFVPEKIGKSKWGVSPVKRVRRASKYSGMTSSSLGIDRAWLYAKTPVSKSQVIIEKSKPIKKHKTSKLQKMIEELGRKQVKIMKIGKAYTISK